MEGFFNIFICSSTYKCTNTAQIHSHHICMYFDGSSCSFQRLLVCCTRGHKVYIRNSMYYYECLRTNTDYVLVSIYSIICTYMFAYVSLRQYTNVTERSRTTFIYVSIHSNMQICWTTYHHDVTYLAVFSYAYNIRILLPIHTYQHGYIRVTRIYIQIRTKKNVEKYIQKYVDAIHTIIQTILYIYTCHYGSEISIRANTYKTVY